MGFSTPAALRGLDLFSIIHTNLSRLRLHTNARTAPPGFAVAWWDPPGAFGVLPEGFLVFLWCFLGLFWRPGFALAAWSGRGSAAVALPRRDAVLHPPRRAAGPGESRLEKPGMNSITSRPFSFIHPHKMKKETVRGRSSKFSVSRFSLIWWRGTFCKGV